MNIKKLHEKLLDIISIKIKCNMIGKNDINFILNAYNQFDYKTKEYLLDFLIKSSFNKKQLFSYEFFLRVFSDVLYNDLKKYIENPKLIISRDLRDNNYHKIFGKINNEAVELNEILFQQIYYGNIIYMKYIFQELVHVTQNYRLNLSNKLYLSKNNFYINLFDLQNIKEKIIINENPDFYDNNYRDLNIEKEADCYSKISLLNYAKKLKINIDEDKKIESSIKYDFNNNKKENRFYKNSFYDLDDIFDNIILNTNKTYYLEKYKGLNIEYIIDKGIIRRKNYYELLKDYQNINFNKLNIDKQFEIQKIYEYLFNKSKGRIR